MWANSFTFPEGRNDPEILRLEAGMPKDQFLRRVCGIPTPSRKLILGDVWKPRLGDGTPHHCGYYPFVRKDEHGFLKPVELFIDPGWGDDSYYYVGAIQWEVQDGREVYKVIDEIAVQHHTHQQVARIAQSKNWWANVTGGVVEPYGGAQHSVGSSNSVEEWAAHASINIRMGPYMPLDERISFLRDALHDPSLGRPRIYFNDKMTPRIQYEAGHWRRQVIKSNALNPGRPSELHCDGLKALASWLTERVKGNYDIPNRPTVKELEYVW
jgi:hypothetical protein